jgi:hypothetical protein
VIKTPLDTVGVSEGSSTELLVNLAKSDVNLSNASRKLIYDGTATRGALYRDLLIGTRYVIRVWSNVEPGDGREPGRKGAALAAQPASMLMMANAAAPNFLTILSSQRRNDHGICHWAGECMHQVDGRFTRQFPPDMNWKFMLAQTHFVQ